MKWGLGVLALLCACQAGASGPYEPIEDARRDSVLAAKLSREASELIYEDPDQAEELLTRALGADLFHGPAHNNLGVLYLSQDRLYEAAGEFEWARKLMPGHPDPRLNLALTLERAGRMDEAIQAYESALEVYPGHVPSQQALAAAYVARETGEERLHELLTRIALEGEDETWREWARQEIQGAAR